MKKRSKFNRILSFVMSLSLVAGDTLPAFAADSDSPEEEVSIVSIDEVQEDEEAADEAPILSTADDAEDVDAEEEGFTFVPGYLANPFEAESPALDPDLSYRESRAHLSGDPSIEYETVHATSEASAASASDSAYPYGYDGAWLNYFTTNFPDTRDQNPYGSCWAHSAMGIAEFNLISHGKANKNIDLSELHLNYWSYNQGTASPVAGDTGDRVSFSPTEDATNILNNGGDVGMAAQQLMRQRGFALESVAPYTQKDYIAGGGTLAASTERQDSYYLENAYKIDISNAANRSKVKEAIIDNGALGVSYYATTAMSASYSDFYSQTYNAYYCNQNIQSNHAVCVVGWDDDFPKEYFPTQPSNDGAWLIRNSWSTTSAKDYASYFWMSYEDASLGGGWVYEVSDTFPYDNHYYYDSAIHGSAYFQGYKQFGNIYTISGECEKLEAVDFEISYLSSSNTAYTVEIYKNPSATNPVSGTKVGGASGVLDYLGQYTIKLDEPVILEQGDKFSVVVKFDKNASIALETGLVNYNGVKSTAGAATGQSFFASGSYWYDLYTQYGSQGAGNFIIAALTTDVELGEDQSKVELTPETLSFTKKGATKQLNVKVYDRFGNLNSNATVTYTSSDEDVATVSDTGLITSTGSGTATITAKSGKLTATCAVTVTVAKSAKPSVDKASGTVLYPGDMLSVTCSTEGAEVYYTTNGTDPTKSSSKVTDGNIKVKGSAGEFTLKLRAFSDEYDPSDIATYTYTLDSKAGASLDKTELELTSTAPTATLTATLFDEAGEEVSNPGFTWESSDVKVATISAGGKVTAVGSGSAVITATSGDYSVACNVTVSFSKAGKPAADKTGATLRISDTIKLISVTEGADIYYTLDGSDPDKKSTKFSGSIKVTSDMVDQEITLKAIAYATYYDPSDIFTYTFTVESKAGVSLSATTLNLTSANPVTKLSATVYTADGSVDSEAAVSWNSADESVATVADGKITAAGSGTTTITATSGKLSASCEVKVTMSKLATPSVHEAEGTIFSIGDEITVECSSAAAGIYYTLDGTEPTKESALTKGTIKIGKELAGKAFTLKFRAFADYYEASDIVSIEYSVEDLSELKLSKSLISFTKAGATEKITAVVCDASGAVSSNAVISWSSSDEAVATVDKGVVTAVASGKAVITASSGSLSAKCEVVVVTDEERDPAVSTNIILDPDTIEINGIGNTEQINVTVTDQYGLIISKPSVSFESSDENIATVSKTGAVKSVSAGDAVITVKSGDVSANCTVKVSLSKLAKPVASVNSEASYRAGMEITVKCASTGAEIRYTTDGSDPTKDSELLTGKFAITKEMAGKTITLKLRAFADGCEASETASYEIKVEDLSAIELSNIRLSFTEAGVTKRLSAIVYDAAGDEDDSAVISWSSSDEAVVTVDDGKVTSVGEGDAVITASCGELTATCNVRVKIFSYEEPQFAANIILTPEIVNFDTKGQTKQLSITVEDQYGLVIDDPELYFASSDEEIATVDDYGTITAVSSGYAVICVLCDEEYAFCDVYVDISGEDPFEPTEPEEKECYSVKFYVGGILYAQEEVEKGSSAADVPADLGDDFIGWTDKASGDHWNPTSPVYSDLELEARFADTEAVSAYSPIPGMEDVDIYMVKGQKFQLEGKWESSKPSIVNISKKGVLTAKKADPTGTVIFNLEDSSDYRVVYVIQPTMSKTLTVQAGAADKLNLDLDMFADEYNVAWTSSAPSIAVVNGGSVYGIAKGSATITAVVNGKTYTCKVKVNDTEKVKVDAYTDEITLSPMQSVATKLKGEWTADGKSMENISTTNKPVYANSVVSITDAGKITAIGSGVTNLSVGGRKIKVTVKEPVEQVQYIAKGKKKTLKFTSVKNVQGKWSSSDSSVVNVNEKGAVTALKTGEAVITCTYNPTGVEGAGFTYVTRFYVEDPDMGATTGLSKVKNTSYTYNTTVGTTLPLRFTQNSSYAVYQSVAFKSSKPAVAYVDECGVLHAIGSGKTKLTAKINGKTISITVNVN